ncbi:hypothetical protein [Aurantiacibacter gangjinensis]|uniref:Uncharacterized protein n=1 Tax=Aurantiacibacter gangjinensis TaxID=502682 RepID=A0A0G9MK61_9SPHN|nr:hypothetical protein [Aurantiacibacter gangjinensis]KLE31087.1 hypothetical protein AAW01_12660 [Aurantiacibacter gangjinensis]
MRIFVMALLVMCASAVSVRAQETVQRVGVWSINSFDGGCFMEATASDGTTVVYEVSSVDGSLTLLLGNRNWAALTSRDHVNLSVNFRSYRLLTTRYAVVRNPEFSFVRIPIPERYARNMFPMMITISVYHRNEMIFIHGPTRSDQDAFNATLRCAGAERDPFAG